jgi:aminobenzoyl-glutamate utilization protein B
MRIAFPTSAALACALATPGLAQKAAPDPLALVDARYDRTAAVAKAIWDFAELGYQETRSSALLQAELAKEGFKVTKGVAEIPTAFVAEWGSGGPVIAILAEFDALPGVSQAAVPVKQTDSKSAAHACGHNLFGSGSVTAAIALSQWLKATGTPGRVRLYGTPAEEGGSGKVYMVRAGLFSDVDFALHWHPSHMNSAAAQTTLANRSAKFRFKGKAAHAAGAPAQGRSALDGVEAMNMMVNMMREHTTMDSRIHYVITDGGSAPNVVPETAEVFYYVRHSDTAEVEAMWKRLEDAAKGAALGTGTQVEWEIIHGNNPLLVNETLARMMDGKLRQIGGMQLSEDEKRFASEIAKTLAAPKPVEQAAVIEPYGKTLGYGSTDVGDVSWATPTVGLNTASWAPGTPAHSWQSAAASGTSMGFKGAQLAAKAMTLAAIQLYTDPALRQAARAEFDASRGPNYQYRSLLGDRKPPLDFRK